MRNRMDYNQACTGLVDSYIGSAFDTVKLIADHLHQLEPLFDMKKGDFQRILDLAPDLVNLLKQLDHFTNRYYGAFDTEPTGRPNGNRSEYGDLYYDNVRGGLYIYERMGWVPITGVDNIIDSVVVEPSHFHNTNVVIPVKHGFDAGTNNLMVFVNGVYQYAISKETPNGAYVETDSHTITFPGATLKEGDLVTSIVGKVVTNVKRQVGTETGTYRTVQEGERVITLPSGMYYDPGIGNLEVYVDGKLQIPPIDYAESDKNTVTFSHGLHSGSLVAFKKGSIISTGTSTGSGTMTSIRVLSLMAEINFLPLDEKIPLVCKGRTTVGDGGFGLFLYEPLVDRADANGGTIIDPSQTLPDQGKGSGNGCWVRQYDGTIEANWFGKDRFLMADLADIRSARHGDLVDLEGFHVPGDGGEGMFYWDENISTNQHDGGMIIGPKQPFPPAWGALADMQNWYDVSRVFGTGAWRRMHTNQANLFWWGAIDGTDCSAIFNGIGHAVLDGHLEKLEIPAGDFWCGLPAQMDISNFAGNLKIFGSGQESRIIFSTGAPVHPFQFTNCQGIEIDDIYFIDHRLVAADSILSFLSTDRVLVNRCWFENCPGVAVEVREDYLSGNPSKASDDIHVTECHFEGCGQAVHISSTIPSKNQIVDNNAIINCGSNGACVQVGQASTDIRVLRNIFNNCQNTAIRFEAYDSGVISNNEIESFTGDAIDIFAGSTAQYPTPQLTQLFCRNNIISGKRGTTREGYGIYIHGSGDAGFIEVDNNTTVGVAGIQLNPERDKHNIIITSNKIQDAPDTYAVLLESSNGGITHGLYFADNYIENENKTRNFELLHAHGLQETTIKNNVFRRSGLYDIGLVNCDNTQIISNVFLEPNVMGSTTGAIIQSSDTNPHNLIVTNNEVVRGKLGKLQALLLTQDANTQVRMSNNRLGDIGNVLLRSPTVTTILDGGNSSAGQSGTNRIFFGSTIPVAGTYDQGDIMYNTGAAASGQVGWVCITAGTPGTWKAFGTIEP